jgi:hypothetical protein
VIVLRPAISRVCLTLVALCFVSPIPAQSTLSSDEPIPASEVNYRHPVLETSRFIAYLLEIPPHHATLMHRHDRDILSVFVSGAKTTSTLYGHEPISDAIPSGESRFRAADVNARIDQRYEGIVALIEILTLAAGLVNDRISVGSQPQLAGDVPKIFP